MTTRTLSASTTSIFSNEDDGIYFYSGNRKGDASEGATYTVIVEKLDGIQDAKLKVLAAYEDDVQLTVGNTSTRKGNDGDWTATSLLKDGKPHMSIQFNTSANGTRWATVRPMAGTISAKTRSALDAYRANPF